MEQERYREWMFYVRLQLLQQRPELEDDPIIYGAQPGVARGRVIVELGEPWRTVEVAAMGPYEWGLEMLVSKTISQVVELVAMAMGDGATTSDARAAVGRWVLRVAGR